MGHVHIGDFEQVEGKDPSVTELPHWQSLIDHLKVKGGDFLKALRVFLNMFVKKFNILSFFFISAFPEITVARSAREGVLQLARISGLGAMKPNTGALFFYTYSKRNMT